MSDASPIPIVATGLSWTAIGALGTFVTVLGTIITLIIKQVGPWKKQTTDAEEKLRAEMWAEIASLRSEVGTLRTEIAESHLRCEQILAEVRRQHALEMHDLREHHLLELANALGRKISDERPTL